MSINAKRILSTVLGLALTGFGGLMMYLEMSGTERHSTRVYVFSGFIAVGCFIVAPAVIGGALKQALGYLPSIKIGKAE